MKWRKWNNILHRDLGYLCVGLTVIYVVSGVAVNHIADWNPSFDVDRREVAVAGVTPAALATPDGVHAVLARVGLGPSYRTTFPTDSATLRIFLEDGVVDVNHETGIAAVEVVRPRPILRQANFLHLNHAKRLWTWLADLYAVALGLLAVTGLFVLKGKKGITGRGAWLTGAGIVLPLVVLWLYL
jgi:hypothetical protein